MPRQQQNRQFERMSLDDILAGRVDNEAFFDIDGLPVDAPAVAIPFIPTPIESIVEGQNEDVFGADIDLSQERPPLLTRNPLREPRDPAIEDPLGERAFIDGIDAPAKSARSRNDALRLEQELLEQSRLLDRQIAERERWGLPPTAEQLFMRDRMNRLNSDEGDLLPLPIPGDAFLKAKRFIENDGGALPMRNVGFLEASAISFAQNLTGDSADELDAGVRSVLTKATGDRRALSDIFEEKVLPNRRLVSEARRQQPLASTRRLRQRVV